MRGKDKKINQENEILHDETLKAKTKTVIKKYGRLAIYNRLAHDED